MSFFKLALPHYFSKVVHHPDAILYHTSSLDVWPSELVDKPDRFVEKVESCIGHTVMPGLDGRPPVVDHHHKHTFLRITVAPTEDHPEETIFVERVLVQRGCATHSVIPIETSAAAPASADDPDPPSAPSARAPEIGAGDALHDHACVVLEGSPDALLHTHHRLLADRTTRFTRCPDRRLSLLELATVLRFVSTAGLRAVSLGMDTACETYARWFCRASMAALEAVMRHACRHLVPPTHEAGVCVEVATQKSVEAWVKSTLRTAYPVEVVAADNLKRQMDLMSHEERKWKLEQIAHREDEVASARRVNAMYRERIAATCARLRQAEMSARGRTSLWLGA